MPMDVDGYDVAPRGLELQQAHIYVRHGERTPVSVRMKDPPASIPEYWNLCKAAHKFLAAVYPHDTLEVRRVCERATGIAVAGECMLGELTDLGRNSTYKLGLSLRQLYKNKLGFLPETVTNAGMVYFRSTNMPRTIESLQQVMHGLYPKHKYEDGVVPRVLIRHGKDENLVANAVACDRLRELEAMFASAAALEHNPNLCRLDHRLSQYNSGRPIRVDGKPRLCGIMDTIRAAQAHNIAVPAEFSDPEVNQVLESAVCAEWFGGYKSTEFRKLAMGRLLDDLQTKLQRKSLLASEDPLKISIMACHDSSIAGLLATLDVFDTRWPEFSASLSFELFSQQTSRLSSFFKGGTLPHFVRMRYKDKNIPLPACSAPSDHLPGHPELCTLQAFQRHVQTLIPSNWEEDCKVKRRSIDR